MTEFHKIGPSFSHALKFINYFKGVKAMSNEQTSYRDIINNYINGNKVQAVKQMKAYNIHAFTELLETDENMLLYEKYKILRSYCLLSDV